MRKTVIENCISEIRQPFGARASAALALLDDAPHRLRRGALHMPTRRSRQNVNLFLREP
jgi:hypothetical protein